MQAVLFLDVNLHGIIADDTMGLIVVFGHLECQVCPRVSWSCSHVQDVVSWVEYFVLVMGLQESQCRWVLILLVILFQC